MVNNEVIETFRSCGVYVPEGCKTISIGFPKDDVASVRYIYELSDELAERVRIRLADDNEQTLPEDTFRSLGVPLPSKAFQMIVVTPLPNVTMMICDAYIDAVDLTKFGSAIERIGMASLPNTQAH